MRARSRRLSGARSVTPGTPNPSGKASGRAIDTYVGEESAAISDPVPDAWTELPHMAAGRWYPSNVTLADGSALTVSGSIDELTNNDVPEVWSADNAAAWRELVDARR